MNIGELIGVIAVAALIVAGYAAWRVRRRHQDALSEAAAEFTDQATQRSRGGPGAPD